MLLEQVTENIINPAMKLLPAKMDTPKARVMLLAIGLQESRFQHTHQIGGPAHGYWQFESGGGTKGVMEFSTTKAIAQKVAKARGVAWNRNAVFAAIEEDQIFACAFARLLLWTDPKALPEIGEYENAWQLYLRVWRPGKPHRNSWNGLYRQAMFEVARPCLG